MQSWNCCPRSSRRHQTGRQGPHSKQPQGTGRSIGVAAAILACLLTAPRAQAQFIQQGAKLVGTGAVASAQQGRSVAVSADGNTAVVGGFNDSSSGAAWVYTRSGGVWSQQGAKLVGTGAVGNIAGQGFSVSLSDDGNTAIVGGEEDSGFAGAAWVYTSSVGVWTPQAAKLVGTGAAG